MKQKRVNGTARTASKVWHEFRFCVFQTNKENKLKWNFKTRQPANGYKNNYEHKKQKVAGGEEEERRRVSKYIISLLYNKWC